MGILSTVLAGGQFGAALKQAFSLIPKGGRRKTAAGLAQAAELESQALATWFSELSQREPQPDPAELRAALMAGAFMLARQKSVFDTISDILIGDDDE